MRSVQISYCFEKNTYSYIVYITSCSFINSFKVFKANEVRSTMVINRFHRAFQAQLVKLNFLNWNRPSVFEVCARVEIFACKEGKVI